MVGIFGCILEEANAAPVVHEALKRLEYRGYDSVGQAPQLVCLIISGIHAR